MNEGVERMTIGLGQQATDGLWYRGARVYGGRGSPILVHLYWPMNDPRPAVGWWFL